MTFRGAPGPEQADKRWRLWCSKLNRHLFGSHWSYQRGRALRWVRATELQQRGAIHFHALLGSDALDLAMRKDWESRWFAVAGFSRIEAPRSGDAVAAYCSKYVTKGGELDLAPGLRACVVGTRTFAALFQDRRRRGYSARRSPAL